MSEDDTIRKLRKWTYEDINSHLSKIISENREIITDKNAESHPITTNALEEAGWSLSEYQRESWERKPQVEKDFEKQFVQKNYDKVIKALQESGETEQKIKEALTKLGV